MFVWFNHYMIKQIKLWSVICQLNLHLIKFLSVHREFSLMSEYNFFYFLFLYFCIVVLEVDIAHSGQLHLYFLGQFKSPYIALFSRSEVAKLLELITGLLHCSAVRKKAMNWIFYLKYIYQLQLICMQCQYVWKLKYMHLSLLD